MTVNFDDADTPARMRLAKLGERFKQRQKEQAQAQAEQPKKRGPGRPPKKPQEPEKKKKKKPEPEESDSDSDDSDSADDDADAKEKMTQKLSLVRKVEQMKKKLGAYGTGLKPSTKCSTKQLQEELHLLNMEVNERRGVGTIERIIVDGVAPAAEMGADALVPKEDLDLTGLRDEIKDNWKDYFAEPAEQYAINHPELFEVGPLAELCKAFAMAAISRNTKNQLERKAALRDRLRSNVPMQFDDNEPLAADQQPRESMATASDDDLDLDDK